LLTAWSTAGIIGPVVVNYMSAKVSAELVGTIWPTVKRAKIGVRCRGHYSYNLCPQSKRIARFI
jgi:hypothetical protein